MDPQVVYSQKMAQFSLLDVEKLFKNYNGAPAINKYSGRPDFFIAKEEADPDKMRKLNYMLMQREQQAKEREQAEGNKNDQGDLFHKLTF